MKKPLDGESCKEWIARLRNRSGTKNKIKQTVSIRDIWNRSRLKEKFPFGQYKKVIMEMGKAMRVMLCRGHEVPIPKFGYLSVFQYKPEITQKKSKFSDGTRLVDYRTVNFVKAMENKYSTFVDGKTDDTADTAIRNSGINIYIGLRRRGLNPKCKLIRFYAQKYVAREVKNQMYGYNYVLNA